MVKILQSSPYRVRPHERVRFECTAVGEPKPNLVWRKMAAPYGTAVAPLASREEDGKAVLEIYNVSAADTGTYMVMQSSYTIARSTVTRNSVA